MIVESVEKAILDIHGIERTWALLEQAPKDATKIAVCIYKCGSIFYKESERRIFVDYSINQGWQHAQYTCFVSLEESLKIISFLLVDIEILKKEIELRKALNRNKRLCAIKPLKGLEQQVMAQIEKVDLRREHSDCQKSKEYWQGHVEAYEIVKYMIRNLNVAA